MGPTRNRQSLWVLCTHHPLTTRAGSCGAVGVRGGDVSVGSPQAGRGRSQGLKAAREGRGQAERQAVALPGFQKGQEQEGEEHV